MRRLLETQLELIRTLASRGLSLNQIANCTGVKKSTVGYHLRRNSPIDKRIVTREPSPEEVGELVGAFAGDGNYHLDSGYRHATSFFISDGEPDYASWLISELKVRMGLSPWIFKKPGCVMIRVISKDFALLIRRYLSWERPKSSTVSLAGQVQDYSDAFLVGFMRGLLDTDGYTNLKVRRVVFTSVSPILVKQCNAILHRWDLRSVVRVDAPRARRKPLFRLDITGADAARLLNLLKPHNPLRIPPWLAAPLT